MHPHPECADGEDEIGCFEQYIERGFVSSSADYVCQSPYHNDGSKTPRVNILAVRCDGVSECWQGADEEGCNINGLHYMTGSICFKFQNHSVSVGISRGGPKKPRWLFLQK